MSRCLITYEDLPGSALYSAAALHRLSPRLDRLHPFPYDRNEQLEQAARLAGKLSIQGVQPKLSVRLDVTSGQFVVVERGGTYILKPQNPMWPELPENEDLTMRLAGAAGIAVPLHGLLHCKDGSLSYFVRRFDRAGRGVRLAVEDFAQLTGKSRDTKYDSSMEQVAAVLDRYATFPAIEKVKLFALTLFSFLTGNEDMHLKNFSLVSPGAKRELSPAYDLVNSTIAVPGAEDEMALPIRGKKRKLSRSDLVDYLGRERLGLNSATVEAVLERFASAQPRWRLLIDASFLSPGLKGRYESLLFERVARLGLAPAPISGPA